MNDFERGIARAVEIYTAGMKGQIVPYFPGMQVKDVEELYSAGVLRALEEIDSVVEARFSTPRR